MSGLTVIALSMVIATVVAYWTWLDREDVRHTIRAWLLTSALLTLAAIFVLAIVSRLLFEEESSEPSDDGD